MPRRRLRETGMQPAVNPATTSNGAAPAARPSLLSSGAIVFGATMAMNLGGFLFHAIAGRALGVVEYGALYTLISMYALAAQPVTTLSPVIARYAAEFHALHDASHLRGLAEYVVRIFGALALLSALLATIFAVPIAAYVREPAWAVVAVGIGVAFATLSGSLRAFCQGTHAFTLFGISMLGEGIAKVILLLGAVLLGLGLFGGVAAFMVGLGIGGALIIAVLLRSYRGVVASAPQIDWPRVRATLGGSAASAIAGVVMGSADVILVKHYFNARDAGLYAAASLGGKIVLYFIGFAPTVLLPHFTHRAARGESTRRVLLLVLAATAAIGVVAVIAYHFEGLLLLHVLVGNAFDAALPLMQGYAAAMALLAMTTALVTYGLATHRLGFAIPQLLAAALTLAAIVLRHPSPAYVVLEMIAGNALMLLVVGAAIAAQAKRRAA